MTATYDPLRGVLIPPSLYLIWNHDVRDRGLSRRFAFLALILCGLVAAYFAGLFDFAQKVLLPLTSSADRTYAALTITNFWERLNGFILCAPAAIPLAVILWRNRQASTGESRTRYLTVAGFMGIVFLIAFDFVLGSQDWDVMALVTFLVCIVCAHGVSKLREDTLARVSVPVAAICLLSTLPWIITNHTDASIDRLEDTVINEPAGYFLTHNRAIRIALALLAEDHRQDAIDVLEREASHPPENPQVLYNLETIHYGTVQYAETILVARLLLAAQPYNVATYRMLLESLRLENRTEEAKRLIQNHSEELIGQAERAYIDGDQNTAAMGWGPSAFMDLQDPSTLSRSSDALGLLISVYHRNREMTRPIPFRDIPKQMRALARQRYGQGIPEDAMRFDSGRSRG